MPQEDKKVCAPHEVKLFCKDYVEKAEVMFILATVSCLLVILSLVREFHLIYSLFLRSLLIYPNLQIHYLMCLSANYAHIRDHEKFQELQEIQYLAELDNDVHTSKDRF